MDYYKIQFFNGSNSFFNKNYLDHLIEGMRKKRVLTQHENKIILDSKIKYYSILLCNVPIFFYMARRHYKISLKNKFQPGDTLHFIGSTLLLMSFIFVTAEKLYYNDVKYLILKNSYIEPEDIENAKLNSLIMKKYEKGIEE